MGVIFDPASRDGKVGLNFRSPTAKIPVNFRNRNS